MWRCFFPAIPKGQRGQRANIVVVALACRFVKLLLLDPTQPNVRVYVATLVCVISKSKCLYLPPRRDICLIQMGSTSSHTIRNAEKVQPPT